MKFNYKKFKKLIEQRHQADYDIRLYLGVQSIWEDLVAVICKTEVSFSVFIEYMKTEMSDYEYFVLSEISYDLVGIYPWTSFIDAYHFLAKKYPKQTKKHEIFNAIYEAEEYVKSRSMIDDENTIFSIKQFKDLIMERKIIGKCPLNYWDLDLVWEKLVKLICASEASFSVFIEYMKTKMTACEYSTLKEISDDIVAIFPWISFIKAYRFLEQRYPTTTKEYNIKLFIDDAEEYVLSKNN
ncbi:hypothetical protein UUR2_0473 [Ureaplasma urealyticum serovar 2 str. ATCC 27814]|uniref:hypothetical protein n=1 Tax=Ureaplasma urealyticum TaxID=2130 RepID=UPI0001721F2A|nr:hypothetical protein [Ureaplasma urealyticum]EDT49401.1 hypothetical protein UUR13_0085 [Ureaplasma urealyticum serovar 13 str. ATCC 33698]EEH02387.1 hypothetical protein UUR2_0473 [Ureaplasma urealyticum serovar 2 str. ATCC 27814]